MPIWKKLFYAKVYEEIRYLNLENILDVGCAEGDLIKYLLNKKSAKVVEGIDVSEKQIEKARKVNPHLIIKKGDIYDIPCKSKSFDLVVATQVFEHLKFPRRALKEMERVSKKYILVSVFNEKFFKIPGHRNNWKPGEFQKFVNARGLKIVAKTSPFPWTIALLKKV